VGRGIDSRLERKLTELFREYGPEATRLAYLITGDRELAQDITQEAFVRLFGRYGELRNPDAVRGYLRKTIVNLTRSHFRKRRSERTFAQRAGSSRDIAAWQPDIGLHHDLFVLLQTLPYRQRAALTLRFYLDLSEGQAAEALGASPKAINALVSRGLATLRERVDELR
jgi:RNA polymerase sigma factor (sigma-70 family)